MENFTNMSTIDLSKEDLQLEYESLKKQFETCNLDLESKNQKIYDLKRELSRLQTTENDYLHEMELQKNEQKTNQIENTKLKEDIQKLTEELLTTKESIENVNFLEDEILTKNEEIESLNKEVKRLANLLEVRNDNKSEVDKLIMEINAFKEEKEILINNNQEIVERYEQLQANYEEMCIDKRNLELEMVDLRENYKIKKDELKESQFLLENLQGELIMVKNELDSLKVTPLDPESRGNSIFAEVNDRRVFLEKSVNLMKTNYNVMKNQVKKLTDQVATLHSENIWLTTSWQEEIKDCKFYDQALFEVHEKEVHNLKELIDFYKKKLEEKIEITEENVSKDLFFIQNLFKDKEKETLQLLDKINRLSTSESIMARKIWELKKEAFEWKALSHKNECSVSELKMKIEIMSQEDDKKTNCNQSKRSNKTEMKNENKPEPAKKSEKVMSLKDLLGDKNTNEPTSSENASTGGDKILEDTNIPKEQKSVKFSSDTKNDDGSFITRRRGKKLTCKPCVWKENIEDKNKT